MMKSRFLHAFLSALFFCCLTALASAQEYSASEGEIRFDGTLVSFNEDAKTLIINVSSFTLPSGKSSELAAAKPKTITLLPTTAISIKDLPDAQFAPYLKAGARIIVVGKDAGTGTVVPARLVLVIPPAGASTPSAGASEEPKEPAEGEPIVRAGETRYEGKVTGVLSPQVFIVSVALQINDAGETTELTATQNKTVEMSADTNVHSRSDAAQKLKFDDVKVGQRVTLVGKGTGRIVKAREVAIWQEDSSKTRYHGSVTVSQAVAVLSKKGDDARDARIYDEAIKFYNQALQAAQGANDSNGQALIYGRLGLTYRQLKQNKRAMESFQSALAIWKRIGNDASAGLTWLSISRIHTEAKETRQARVAVDEAIRGLEAGGNSLIIAMAYGQRGHIQADQDQMTEALASWQRALSISRQFKSVDDERTWLAQVAIAHSKLNQTAKATETIMQLLPLIPLAEEKSEQATSYYMIGMAYRNLSDNAKAIENMKRAETIFTEAGQRENATDARKLIELWSMPEDDQPQPKKEIRPAPGAALPA